MIALFKDPFFSPWDSVFETMDVGYKPKSIVDKNNNGYSLKMSVPGLTKDDIKIKVKDGKLTIDYQNEDSGENHQFVEKFTKTYILSDDIVEDKIKAEVKNGVLLIDLPINEKKLIEKLIPIE